MKVFLGGTCNGSKWRDTLIPQLNIDYFNPVVPHWTEEAKQEELYQRETCDFVLYVITPHMAGYYSIAEVIDDSNKRPEKTIFCVLYTEQDGDELFEFGPKETKSLLAVGAMVYRNGGAVFSSLEEVSGYLNAHSS